MDASNNNSTTQSESASSNYTMLQLPNKVKQQKSATTQSPPTAQAKVTVSSSGSTGEIQLEDSESPVTPRKASTASSQQLIEPGDSDDRPRLTSMYAPPYEMVSCLKGSEKPDRIDCYGNDIVTRK